MKGKNGKETVKQFTENSTKYAVVRNEMGPVIQKGHCQEEEKAKCDLLIKGIISDHSATITKCKRLASLYRAENYISWLWEIAVQVQGANSVGVW